MATATKAKSYLAPRLDAYRGFGCLLVVMVHIGQINVFGEQLGREVPRWAINGHAALTLFFVLSGYVLLGAMRRSIPEDGVNVWGFVVQRIFRLYPAVVVTIVVFILFERLTGLAYVKDPSLPLIIQNMLMIDISMDGVMWTLQVEVVAIPVIILAFLLWRRYGLLPLFVLFVTFTALSFSRNYNDLLVKSMQIPLHAFIAGMIVAIAGAKLVPARSRDATLLFYLALAVLIFARHMLSWTSNWSILVEVLAGGLLVILTVKADNLVFVGWLDNRIGRFYGRISYSFYLVHPLTMLVFSHSPGVTWLEQAIASGIPRVVVWFAVVLVSTLAVTPLAVLMHRWIELPPIGVGKVVTDRLVGASGSAIDRTAQISRPPATRLR